MNKLRIAEHDADMIHYLNRVTARFGFNVFMAEEALDPEPFAFPIMLKSLVDRGSTQRLGQFAARSGDSAPSGASACPTSPFEMVFIPDFLDGTPTPARLVTEPEGAPQSASVLVGGDLS